MTAREMNEASDDGDPTTAPRGLAQRWAARQGDPHEVASRMMMFRGGDGDQWEPDPDALRRLSSAERERLFTWVRERMVSEDDRSPYGTVYRYDLTTYIMGLLAWDETRRDQAHALCEAAGWPS